MSVGAPVAEDLPDAVEHERWYVALSDRFGDEARSLLVDRKEKAAKGRKAKVRKASPLTAAKLADVAIKARRAACEITRWREDWSKTEQLEEEIRNLRQGMTH
jgi:hypothetical protein